MTGSERKIRFVSPVFIDCSGDGLVGYQAGARYRIGREAKYEYNERWGQEQPDQITLGSTILFYTKDMGFPVKYVPPSFAKDITKTPIPEKRIIKSGDSGCFYWWIEWGGELDTVHDNERIRDELLSVVFGIWDYIKNSGKFDAGNLALEWVGYLPGKREYRRFIGDYVLNQNDIENQTPFDDRVAFGGWSIDLHHPKGMYGDIPSKHYQPDGIYHIPFRSLYSVNVRNLLFAGRNISATHIAFGSTRVQGTCATLGEAVGTAAALCVQKGVDPRTLCQSHIRELQRVLLRQDASIIGLTVPDPDNIAPEATVLASSILRRLEVERSDETFQPTVQWSMRKVVRKTFCFRTSTRAYGPEKAADGYLRPYGGPRMWASEPMRPGTEEWLEFSWPQVRAIREVQLIFNDDVNEDLINLHHHKTPFEIIPELVKDYRLEAWDGEAWRVVYRESGNRRRRRNIPLDGVETDRLRVVVEATNGCPRAEIMEVRIFSN
jgi:hypothetical protein